MNKLILFLGIALWAVGVRAQVRNEGNKVSLDSIVAYKKSKKVYTYDANGNITLDILYNWNGIKWVEKFKIEYSFDKNRIKAVIEYNWDNNTNKWLEFLKDSINYDVDGKRISFDIYSWNSNTNLWSLYIKTEFSYNANGKALFFTSYTWDNPKNQWIASIKNEYNYDANGNDTTTIIYYIDSATNKFIANSKSKNTYDTRGNRISSTVYLLNSNINQWEFGGNKTEYGYDLNDNNTTITIYNWNSDTKQWASRSKNEYVFDISILKNSLALPELELSNFSNKIISQKEYAWSNGNWSTPINSIYYYSDIITGIEETELLQTHKKLIRILTPLGQELQSEQANEGLFIYQYSDGSTRKVMKQ